MLKPEVNKLDEVRRYMECFAARVAAVVVHLNDTYAVEERAADGWPGFPRLIATIDTLRRWSRKHCGDDRVLVVHSGDFLAPSLLARKDKGQTMVQLMNRAGIDFVVPGNHEFDHGQGAYLERMAEASFVPLLSNGHGPADGKLRNHAVWPTARRPRVAVTGLVGRKAQRAFGKDWTFGDPGVALREFFTDTRDVPFHLVLTHATREEDLAIRESADFPRRAYVLGGHDHDIAFVDFGTTPFIFKNLANLKTVRLMLLVGGGDYAVGPLYARHDAMRAMQAPQPADPEQEDGPLPIDTRANRKLLLSAASAFDREIFADWIERRKPRIKAGTPAVAVLDQWSLTRVDHPASNALALRLHGMPAPKDLTWYLLEATHHAPAHRRSVAVVEAALKRHLPNALSTVLRDFSADTPALDATDEGLRNRPTDFGVLVAECVRLQAQADVVILNSGMFRSDTVLPPRLTTLHVQEAFLYECDGPAGVVVYDGLPAAMVQGLIDEALKEYGEGAYPQIAATRPLPATCRLAISSYTTENEACLDECYLDFLTQHWGSPAAGRAHLQAQVKGRVRVVDAVSAFIGALAYPQLAPNRSEKDDASTFVDLAARLSQACEKAWRYSLKRHGAWHARFRDYLATDAPSSPPSANDALRDSLRAFLRSVAGRVPGEGPRLLLHLYKQVEVHRRRYEDDLSYHEIFKYAAKGIAGWDP